MGLEIVALGAVGVFCLLPGGFAWSQAAPPKVGGAGELDPARIVAVNSLQRAGNPAFHIKIAISVS